MYLKDQVITLEQAKKLQLLWFHRDSLYVVANPSENVGLSSQYKWSPCYTASELMDILPGKIWKWYLNINKTPWLYEVYYDESQLVLSLKVIRNKSLANALWDMLIYLIENDLFPVKQ